MSKTVFISFPVTDLAASQRFYEALGATNNPQFTDDTAVCMMLSDQIGVMLLTHDKFRQFTPLPIGDPRTTSLVGLGLSCDSRAAVDTTAEAAAAAGGTIDVVPPQDYGFMVSRSVADPDGHVWDLMWMDMAQVPADPAQAAAPAPSENALTQPA